MGVRGIALERREVQSSHRDGAARPVISASNTANEPVKENDVRVWRRTSPPSLGGASEGTLHVHLQATQGGHAL